MRREKFKWRSHEDESTDADHRGGAARSSDEVSVIEAERRGCIDRLYEVGNQELGGAIA
jgi:RNA-directed DNA polymerase